ncbi:uncharacterized protein GIQ15_00205 [Arthroderma uncinatum]|uniref:uncharacterized protein n=1 Tax=Arthroderma uncinatum TaxID=74035 RepID=UPI00144A8F61|nr:uncharacterized protein GIQ15_00205 [Arthroderma uncinatum]KAF3490688.1 hypothetical protein GIQ15_00205 [Arthroderma uncinatum]
MKSREDVEIKTLDGLVLRGYLFSGAPRSPAIIMTPGFNIVKETIIDDVAEHFHAAGFTVLSYDPRSVGASDGTPRNEIHPTKNMEDYYDALTFLKGQPSVDPGRIAFWGYSFSGMVALCSAALDKRAKAVIAVSPLTIWEFTKWRQVLTKSMKDRESRLSGNKPVYLPMLTDSGEQPAGFGTGFINENVHDIIARAVEVQPTFRPDTTLSSYYHIAAFKPFELMRFVSPTPVMVVNGSDDLISPTQLQRSLVYDVFQGQKQLLTVPNKGHMDILSGQDSIKVFDAQVAFLRRVLN